MKLACLIANRGFFPSSVIETAYEDMRAAFAAAGIEMLSEAPCETHIHAVETLEEGIAFRLFLNAHRGEYDGLVICLPNFGDENGIKAAVRDISVPILLQAYPDEIGQMDFAHRRDAFCGKLALTSVLKQMDVKFTAWEPFVVSPKSDVFVRQLKDFAAVCRVVKKLKHLRVGSIGARTTAFKSVRFDEIALERHGIDVETLDLSEVIGRMSRLSDEDPDVISLSNELISYADFSSAPSSKLLPIAKLGVALKAIIAEMRLDTIAIRCWSELQQHLGITPCVILSLLNMGGIPSACEVDVTNAVAMAALSEATGRSSGCMDLNNNYGDEADKCILFHCGPLPADLMPAKGVIKDHKMLNKTYGEGCSWGLNAGKLKACDLTLAGMRTEEGKLQFFAFEGKITDDPVEEAFFGTPGVLQTPKLPQYLSAICAAGYHHHIALSEGKALRIVTEAAVKYLGYEQTKLD